MTFTENFFKLILSLFLQIHARKAVFIGATILLTGKTRDIYESALEALKIIIPERNPSEGMADYEQACKNAAHEAFPDLKCHGCFFHYTR